MQRALIFLVLVVSFISLIPFSPTQAGSITVDGSCTLIDALRAANSDASVGNCPAGMGADTIILNVDVNLTGAYSGSSTLLGGQAGLPDITTNITIQAGMGSIISGNSTSFRLFNVMTNGTLTLDGITVQNGRIVGNNASAGGGAFYVASGRTLTLLNSTVQNNSAIHTNGVTNGRGSTGGAIYSLGIVNLTNTVLSNNLAQGSDGDNGGFASGGAIYNFGTLSINGSQFINNQVLGGLGTSTSSPAIGGAIANLATITTITNSTFHNNLAQGYGNDGITGHEASSGGAIFNASNVMQISGSTFSANIVMVSSPGENAAGGAIFNRMTFGSVTNSTFSGNSSQKTSGNIAAGGAFYTNSGFPTFNHVTFLNNSSTTSGEDLYLTGPTTVTMNNSILAGTSPGTNCMVNSGVLSGTNNLTDHVSCNIISAGAITLDTHISSLLANNGGPTETHALLDVAGNPAVDGNPGCGLATDQRGELRDVNCDIGAFELVAMVNTPTPTHTLTFTPTNTSTSTPTSETITPSDTATFTATNTDVPPTLTPTWTPSTTPTPEPQDIVVNGSCTLIDAINAANTDTAVGSCPAGNGADTIFLDVDTQLTQAYPSPMPVSGGQAGLPDIISVITIEARLGYRISGNSTNFRIFHITPAGNLTLVGVTVEDGRIFSESEEGRGGGLLNQGTLTLQNTTITANTVESTFDESEASATVSGGGVYNVGTLIVDTAHFSNNLARSGNSDVGGGQAQGGAIANNGVLNVIDSTFYNNRTEGGNGPAGGNASGAALYLATGSDTSISRSTLYDNVSQGGTATLLQDSGHGQGGAIYADMDATLDVDNSTLYGNDALGGAYAGARGDGGAIFSLSSNVVIKHATLISNVASTSGDVILNAGGLINISHSIIASPGGSNDCVGLIIGSGNLTSDTSCLSVSAGTINVGAHVDPLLKANGGPTLTNALLPIADNPAIDGSYNCGYATDQRGVLRDEECDIGAYEVDETSPTPTSTDTPPLEVTAQCIHPNLVVTILNGDAPFEISASAGVNVPVMVFAAGPVTINGPEKWDDLTVTELSGNLESINLGQFKCRPLEIPQPLTPGHQQHTTNRTPVFSWTPISDANTYRVFLFDDKVVANRTVDMRQNSIGNATSLVFDPPLPIGRLFWRVRGRVNRVWGYWSIRFTLFVDPVPAQLVQTPVPTIITIPTAISPPNSR
ncbi:MAG: hypothetical protein L0154_01700 [Chloroflexi bacterium]|nr:hypothetical protein [Chloroflexota bacterium]